MDGSAHDHEGQISHDARRYAWLAQRDIRVMRIAARGVLADEGPAAILDMIAATAAPSTTLRAVPRPDSAGED